MKLKLLLITIALFVGFGSWGQTTLLNETFGTTATLPTGWTSSNTSDGWAGNVSSPSSTYTSFSAGANALFGGTGTNGVTHTLTYSNSLSTVGYNTITVLWGGRGTTAFNGVLTFQWSSDGITWNNVAYSYAANGNVWALVNSSVRISLPIGAEGLSNLRLRWSAASTNSGNYRIDDLTVQGTLPPTQLALVNIPATGTRGTPLSTFTVEARNAGNTLVNSYTGNVTLTKASGTGAISGTLSANAVAGVATFNNVAFNLADTYTITAASTGLTSATSGNVVISNPSTNIFGGDGVNFVGQINGYLQPINCTYGDYRVLQYRKVNTTAVAPTDGRGQWATTVNVQSSGGDVTALSMSGGGSAGFLFTSGGSCGATGDYANKWAFGGVGQGAVDAINGATFNGSTDMGFNMNTAGRYTFVLKDNGYNGTGYYVGYTTNAPVTITHNVGTQRTLNNDGTTTITATISATNSSQEKFYVRYKTSSNDFSTGTSTVSAIGTVVGTTVTFTIPVQADGAVVYYYIFSSTMSQVALAALSEGDKSYALLNYADNSGNNYSYTALSLTPTVTSIVPTSVTGVTVQANNTGFKGQTITFNGTNFQNNATITINGIAATSVTFISASQLAAVVANTGANFSGNVVVANPTPATSVTVPSFNFLGYITTSNGSLNTTGNWLGGTVPLSNSTITLAHNQALAAVTTNTPFASMTILTGITLDINGASGALTVTGAVTTVGTGRLTFSAGGSVTSGSIVNAGTISFGTGASNANLITSSITNSGSVSWTTAGTLTLNTGGTFTNTGTVTSGTVGNVVFAGTGTINGSTPIAFNNLTINGTTTLATVPTINGALQINSGGNVTAAPTYGSASTLIYNTTSTYGVSNEWTGNGTTAGSGIPKNVTIQNNTTLTMPNSNRGMAGNLNISSGNLTLNATSGDLYLAGSWTRASASSFIPNNRAVFFNGSTNQTVTVTATGTETFNFLIVQGSGTLQLATGTAINVTASSGLSLSSTHLSSTIDLNRQTLTLSGGGNLNLNGGSRFITSSAGMGGIFRITSNTLTVSNGGSLAFAVTNTTVDLQTGLDCGTVSLVNINGTLQINANGFCMGNSPRYGASSLLHYNSGVNPYNRQLEWTSGIAAIGTIGLPQNVQISNNTTLNYINAANSGPKGIAGYLTIDSGSALIMNYGSVSSAGALTVSGNLTNAGTLILGQLSGDDLRLGGNFNNTGGNFDGFDRAIFFIRNATGTQLITSPSGITIPYIVIQPAAGTDTVQLASGTNLTISAPLAGIALTFTNATDIFNINSNTLTIGTPLIANTITGSGTFKGSITSNLTLLGTGSSIGTLKFANDLNLGTFIMNRQAATVGCTMGSAVTINTALNLTNGLISLGNFDMSLDLTATNTGSANGFVISDPNVGTGMLIKKVNSLGAYTLHIGENTAPNGAQYAPATINFSSGTFSAQAYYGVQVKDAIHPNIDSPIDYLTKYWIITSSGTFDTPVYSFTGVYTSGAADINGTESSCISAKWDGTKWTNGTAIGGGTLTISGLTTMATSTTNEISAGSRNKEINIKGFTDGTNNIVSGSNTASGLNNTLFAATNIGSTADKDYEIQNLGIAALNLTGNPIVSIGGANPGDFTVTTVPLLTTIAGGSSTTFIIRFSPTYSGIRTALVSITNDDSTGSENPYSFLIEGTGNAPEIEIYGNGISIVNGSSPASITNNTYFGNCNSASTVAKTFTVFNTGNIALIVSSVAITGVDASDFTITTSPVGSLNSNISTTLVITFNPSTKGIKNALVTINNNDNNENPYTFAVQGNGLNYIECGLGSLETIAIQDFETTPAIPIMGYSLSQESGAGVVTVGGGTARGSSRTLSSNKFIGNQSFQIAGNLTNSGIEKNTTLDFSTIDASAFQEVRLNFKIGAYSTNSTQGLDGGTEFISVFVSANNGITWSQEMDIRGNNNSIWDINTSTGSATFSYDGNNISELYNSGATTTNSGPRSIIINNLPNSTQLKIKIILSIDRTDELWVIDDVKLQGKKPAISTWSAGVWTPTAPTSSTKAIFDGDYTTSVATPSVKACECQINTTRAITISADDYLEIQSDITNYGTLTIKNDGSLVQINDDAVNKGNIRYERTTPPIFRTDYTYWSSPVAGYTLGGVSQNLTLWDKYYSYDSSIEDWKQELSTNTMYAGIGYIIRGPETPFQNQFYAFFIGKPNNGVYSIPTVVVDKPYLLGNPYPSALDADTFLDANSNVLDGTLYFWTHKTPMNLAANIPNPGPGWAYTYSLDDYAAYNPVGGVGIDDVPFMAGGSPAPNGSAKPTGKIASGQGFFASSKTSLSGSSIIYNNSMRVGVGGITGDNTQFFKTINPKTKSASIEKHRIWLNLKNTQGAFKQTLIGYITDATNEYDSRFDGESYDANEFVDFYSINQDKNLVIQGRALPFDENDDVPLGYRTAIEGAFTICIDQVDGDLTNQAVFMEDKLTNTVFDLKTGNYTFNTVTGTFNDRFILRYTNKTLSNKDFETPENQVLVSNKNKQIKINSAVETIVKVFVYDLLGRQIFKKEKVNSNEFSILNLVSSQQTLLVKVRLQNGETVTKKIIY